MGLANIRRHSDLVIENGTVLTGSSTVAAESFLLEDDAQADGTWTVILKSTTKAGLVIRSDSLTNIQNGLLLFVSAGSYVWYKIAAGTYQQIAALTSPPAATIGDVLRIGGTGSALVVKINGVQVYSGTVTTGQANTKHGVYRFSTTSASFSNFQHDNSVV